MFNIRPSKPENRLSVDSAVLLSGTSVKEVESITMPATINYLHLEVALKHKAGSTVKFGQLSQRLTSSGGTQCQNLYVADINGSVTNFAIFSQIKWLTTFRYVLVGMYYYYRNSTQRLGSVSVIHSRMLLWYHV